MSTPEIYIPIAPATRIPFPCWLWCGLNPFPWWARFTKTPDSVDQRGWNGSVWTHYCTSATEPTGRPGHETAAMDLRGKYALQLSAHYGIDHKYAFQLVDNGICSPEAFSGVTAQDLIDCGFPNGTAKQIIELVEAKEKSTSVKSHPAAPTASGATGEALKAWIKQCREKFGHNAFDGKDQWWIGYFEALKDLERFAEKSASRPALAQEGVRDTEMIQVIPTESGYYWMRFYMSGTDSSKLIQLRESSNGLEMLCESGGWAHISNFEKCFFSKKLVDPFAAMSSQPEGRG